MRVTQQSLQEHWISNVQNRLEAMDQLNRQIGSGVRMQQPSDDPAGASRVVRIEEVTARNEQYLKNISEAVAVNRSTDSALGQIYDQLVRAKSLAVEGANDASLPHTGGFSALAEEVSGIKVGMLQLVNSRYQERYLFSGTAGDRAAFGESGGRYQGDSNRLKINIGNAQTVPVNLPGDFAFRETEARSDRPLPDTLTLTAPLRFTASDGTIGVSIALPPAFSGVPVTYTVEDLASAIDQQLQAAGANLQARREADGTLSIGFIDSQKGGEITLTDDPVTPGALESQLGISAGTKNVFGVLDDLQTALGSQDAKKVGAMLDRIDRAIDSLVSQRGLVGARGRNLDGAKNNLDTYNSTISALKADIEGVDLPRAIMRISEEEQAYQTALAAGARLLNVSIIDFLR